MSCIQMKLSQDDRATGTPRTAARLPERVVRRKRCRNVWHWAVVSGEQRRGVERQMRRVAKGACERSASDRQAARSRRDIALSCLSRPSLGQDPRRDRALVHLSLTRALGRSWQAHQHDGTGWERVV